MSPEQAERLSWTGRTDLIQPWRHPLRDADAPRSLQRGIRLSIGIKNTSPHRPATACRHVAALSGFYLIKASGTRIRDERFQNGRRNWMVRGAEEAMEGFSETTLPHCCASAQ